MEFQSLKDPGLLEKESFSHDTNTFKNEKKEYPRTYPGLKRNQSLNELDTLKSLENGQVSADSKMQIPFSSDVKGSSCSDFDNYFEKVSKRTSTHNNLSLDQEISATMLNSEIENNKTHTGSILMHHIIESSNSHNFSTQETSDFETKSYYVNENKIITDQIKAKVNSNLNHKDVERLNLEKRKIESNDMNIVKQFDTFMASTEEKGSENYLDEISNNKQIHDFKGESLARDESTENSNKTGACKIFHSNEISYLETLQEMKNALLNITLILQAEHSEKSTNISKVTELIEMLNEIKHEKQQNYHSKIKTLTSAPKVSSSPELFDDQRGPELSEDLTFLSHDVQNLPWSFLQQNALSDSVNMYQNIIFDVGKALHDNTSLRSPLSRDEVNTMELAMESLEKLEQKENTNSHKIITNIIEDVIENIFYASSALKILKKKEENFMLEEMISSPDTHQTCLKNDISMEEMSPKLSKNTTERPLEVKPYVSLLEIPSPMKNQFKSNNSVMKIVQSIENRSKNVEILNEQEVTEILKHGKEKMETIISQNQLTEKQNVVGIKKDAENSTSQHLGRCLSEKHQKMFENLKSNLFSSTTSEDYVNIVQPQVKSVHEKNLSIKEDNQNNKSDFIKNEQNGNEESCVETIVESIEIPNEQRNDEPGLAKRNGNDLQRLSNLITRSFSETNLSKKEIKFSISTDDLDSNQLLSIHVIGDSINVTTSSKAMASSTIDVTSTENGFNLSLKSKSCSQSNFNFCSKFDSFITEKHISLDDAISPCSSSLGIHRTSVNLDEETECEEDSGRERGKCHIEKQQDCNENVTHTVCNETLSLENGCQNNTPKEITNSEVWNETGELREDEENLVIDDTCSIDTVIENQYWNVGLKKKTDFVFVLGNQLRNTWFL